MPFKIFVLSAGVFGFPLRRFVAHAARGPGPALQLLGLLGAVYGPEALDLLKRFDGWFRENAMALLAVAGLVVAAGLAAWLVRRRRVAR